MCCGSETKEELVAIALKMAYKLAKEGGGDRGRDGERERAKERRGGEELRFLRSSSAPRRIDERAYSWMLTDGEHVWRSVDD